METSSLFNKGFDKDIDKLFLGKDQYLDAHNFRLISTDGSSQYSLNNIKGDILSFSFPNINPVYVLTISPGSATIYIYTSLGVIASATQFTATAGTTGRDLYDFILADANLGPYVNTSTNIGGEFLMSYNNDFVTIWNTNPILNNDPLQPLFNSITTVDPNPATLPSIFFGGSISVTIRNVGILGSRFIPIGWTTIRDTIVIFTTTETGTSVQDGEIWTLKYDDTVSPPRPELRLVYYDYIGFSTLHPIEAVGNYENPSIQKVYWTDYFNKLRSINIISPETFALDSSLIDVAPEVDLDKPILEAIQQGGSLKDGVYNIFYQLTSTSGAGTGFSPTSDDINLIVKNEIGSDITLYYPDSNGGTATTKSIKFRIPIIDDDFDRIRIGYAHRITKGGTPTFRIFIDEPITSDGPQSFILSGNEAQTDITFEEVVAINDIPDKCKTLTVKDSRLLIGNIGTAQGGIDDISLADFDARAYRWPAVSIWGPSGTSANTTWLLDETGNFLPVNTSVPSTATSAWGVSETHDAINPRQVPYDIVDPAGSGRVYANYKFQNDGRTIGGKGPNVSYKIITTSNSTPLYDSSLRTGGGETFHMTGDDIAYTTSNATPYGKKIRNPAQSVNDFTLNGIDYNNGNGSPFFNNYISPYFQELVRGYQREEIYRFGIQLYDKLGRPGFVKWIADILMPTITEVDGDGVVQDSLFTHTDIENTADFVYIGGFINRVVSGTSSQITKSMGVEFTVDINAIRDRISGFSIVRVKREQTDKTILGAGHMFFTEEGTDGSNYLNFSNRTTAPGESSPYPTVAGMDQFIFTYYSPDFMFGGYPSHSTSDEIRLVARTTHPVNGNALGTFFFYKGYETTNTPFLGTAIRNQQQGYLMSTTAAVPRNGTADILGVTFYNRTIGDTTNPSLNTESRTIGEQTLVIQPGTAFGELNFDAKGEEKFYAYYYRPNSAQYGGNTYSQRANNIYIQAGHFQHVDTDQSPTPFEFDVFGGDIYVPIFDYQAGIKNWGVYPTNPNLRSYTYWYPVESTVNTEWRRNDSPGTVNRWGMLDTDNTTNPDKGEFFALFDNYFNENDIKTGVIKPVGFNDDVNVEDLGKFDARIYASEVKINGESGDSWRVFKTNNYLDLDGIYGPINKLVTFKDKVVSIQDKAVAIVSVNPRVLINDLSGTEVQLGTGTVLEDFDYISNTIGSKHQWSVTLSEQSIYFFDIYKKALMKLSFQGGLAAISDAKGMMSYFGNRLTGDIQIIDNPIHFDSGVRYGISSTFDWNNSEMRMTFLDGANKFTVVYNELSDSFTSFYDYFPAMWINPGNKLLSANPVDPTSGLQNRMYIHDIGDYCVFYGASPVESTIKLVVNENREYSKTFDNLMWLTNASTYDVNLDQKVSFRNETFQSIRIYNDYQNTDSQILDPLSLTPNVKLKERSWNFAIPRNRVINPAIGEPNIFVDLSPTRISYGERIRDKYITIDLSYNNLNNYDFTCSTIKTKYRPSSR